MHGLPVFAELCVLKRPLKERKPQVVEWVSSSRVTGGGWERGDGTEQGGRANISLSPLPIVGVHLFKTERGLGELVLFSLWCIFVYWFSASFHLVLERIYGSRDPQMYKITDPE